MRPENREGHMEVALWFQSLDALVIAIFVTEAACAVIITAIDLIAAIFHPGIA